MTKLLPFYAVALQDDVASALCATDAHVRSICCGPFMNVGDDDCIEYDGE